MTVHQLFRFVGIVCLSFVMASFLRTVDLRSTLAAVACTGFDYYFVGTNPRGANVVGVSADMSTVNTPALCGSSHSDSSAWVMIENSDNNECAYAQVGYGRMPNDSTLKVFAE